MEQVIEKYPYVARDTLRRLWREYQYAQQESYKDFLDFYERTTNPSS